MMSPAPREITGPMAQMTMQDADDFDSVLLDYQKKGYKVELIGNDQIDGLPTYHLRVTKKNGRVQDMYLNADTLLETRITMEFEQGDKKGTASIDFSNYKPIDGIMVPFRIRQTTNGIIAGEVTYDQVVFNQPIDDGLFRMPRGTLKHF
jgi:hypothetical protein